MEVREPVVKGAPSRWKDVHYPAECCGHDTVVEVENTQSTVDKVVWVGQCDNDTCRAKKPVHVELRRVA